MFIEITVFQQHGGAAICFFKREAYLSGKIRIGCDFLAAASMMIFF